MRVSLRLLMVLSALLLLSACHYRKGVTVEEAWNELLDSMVPATPHGPASAKSETTGSVAAGGQPGALPQRSVPAAGGEASERSPRRDSAPPREAVWELAQDSDVVGELYVVTATDEDTLFDIARRYGLGISEIQAANPAVDRWLPRGGTTVVLPKRYMLPDAPREGIVLNLSAMRLFYFPSPRDNEAPVVITHPVGIGREEWETPTGLATITQKRANPTWTVPQSILAEHAAAGDPLPAVVPAGPDNPLGAYAMRLSMPGYLLHGTNKPDGVGMRVSHGCVRLYPEDIEALFQRTPVGTPVRILHQPYLAGWDQGVLYFEAFAPVDAGASTEPDLERARAVIDQAISERPDQTVAIDWDRVERELQHPSGMPVPILQGTPDLAATIAALPVYHTPEGEGGPVQVAQVEPNDTTADAQQQPDDETALAPDPGSTAPTDQAPPVAADERSAAVQPTPATAVDADLSAQVEADNGARWYVQAGSFRNPLNADRLAIRIHEDLGLNTSGKSFGPGGLHRVLAGPFESRSEAERSAALIESNIGGSTLVVALDRL